MEVMVDIYILVVWVNK